MIFTLLMSLSGFLMPGNFDAAKTEKSGAPSSLNFQQQPEGGMPAIVFKNQQYCRAEPDENFDFDVQFTVVSADVYFSGANINGVQKRSIKGNSFKTIKDMQDRCTAGTIVVFDNINVLGPDKQIRTISAVSYRLY